jgi:hypothetical protein
VKESVPFAGEFVICTEETGQRRVIHVFNHSPGSFFGRSL